MKTIRLPFLSITMMIATILLAGCQPKNKVIEKPVYLMRNNTSIEVSRITLMDTLTVLDVIANGVPNNWLSIAKTSTLTDDQKNVYPILSARGINLDEGFAIPESGKDSFQLVFPPLDPNVRFVDFSEGPEVENGFVINGLQLKDMPTLESLLPADVLVQQIDKNQSIDKQPFIAGKATIKGKVLDYYQGMPQYVNITSFNPLVGNCGYDFVKLEADGSFEYTSNVLGTSIAWVHYSGSATMAEIFVAPEQTSEIYFNIREAARKKSVIHADSAPLGKEFYYKGPLSTVVDELAEAKKLLREDYKVYDFQKTPKELLEEYKLVQFENIKRHTEAIHSSGFSKATKEYLLAGLPVSLTLNLLNAPYKLAENYWTYVADIADRDRYRELIEDIRQAQTSDYIAYNLSASHNDPQSFFTPDFGLLVKSLASRKQMELQGLMDEMVTATRLYWKICDFVPLKEEEKEVIANMSEPCKQYLNAINDNITSIKESNKKTHGFRVNETGEIQNEDLFPSIISKYRGKVLLIDFWATWCGPCVAGHKSMRPMKAELADKDIVFIYIAGENSPKERWEEMIPVIHGEHYRLTQEQWDYLWKVFNLSGIPTYFIIDREGNIVSRPESGFPGVTKMKEELLRALDM